MNNFHFRAFSGKLNGRLFRKRNKSMQYSLQLLISLMRFYHSRVNILTAISNISFLGWSQSGVPFKAHANARKTETHDFATSPHRKSVTRGWFDVSKDVESGNKYNGTPIQDRLFPSKGFIVGIRFIVRFACEIQGSPGMPDRKTRRNNIFFIFLSPPLQGRYLFRCFRNSQGLENGFGDGIHIRACNFFLLKTNFWY